MKHLFTLFSFLLFSITLIAQDTTIEGIITDQLTGEALISATIKSGGSGTTTDVDGYYRLNLNTGAHLIEISYLGYETSTTEITLKEGENRHLNFTLSEGATLLNTATVSSSKYEKSLGEVTVSLDILKADLIENTGVTNVTGGLNKVSGVSVVDGQANIRGGSGWSYGAGSRVLLLIDDIPALQADAGFPNWVDVPVENISSIEVVKGAASALYGSSAMNGIINVRTAYATSEPYTRVSTFATIYDEPKDEAKTWWKEEGTFLDLNSNEEIPDTLTLKPSFFGGNKGFNRPGKLGFSLAHRQKLGKTDLVLSAYGLTDQSYRQYTFSNYARFNMAVRHRLTDKLSFGFNSNFNKGIGRSVFYWIDGGAGAYRSAPGDLSNSDRFRFTIDPYLTYFGKNGVRHKILTRYYGINNKNDNDQANKSALFYSEYQIQKRWEDLDLNMTAGIVGTWSTVIAPLYNGDYNSSNYAAYWQVDKKFFDKLNVSGGVRYEKNNLTNNDFIVADTVVFDGATVTDSKPVFRLGLNYQPAAYTFIRASWGQGYRFPVIAEKFLYTQAAGLDILPNPTLKPETGWSAEIGIKQGFKVSKFNGYIDVAFFLNEYNDMMEFGFADLSNPLVENIFSFESTNIGNTRIKGMETSLAGEGKFFGLPTTLIAGYTYIDPEYQVFTDENMARSTSDENVLKYRNRHLAKFDIESRYQAFSLGITGTKASKMEAIDSVLGLIRGTNDYRKANDHGYTTFGARLAFIPNDHIRLSLIIDNLTNEEYMTRPGKLDAPRQSTLRLDYTF